MAYLMVVAGLVGLFLGGELLVRGSVGIARRLRMAPLLIGLTVVGFGTSTPELLVSVDAALRDVPDLALGNVVGSNIANILLILGLSALLSPLRVSGRTLPRDATVMLAAALVLVPVFALGEMTRPIGFALLAGLVAYLAWACRQPGLSAEEVPEGRAPAVPLWRTLLEIALGLIGLILGARLLVDGSVTLARASGISEAFIGLTVVAVGTSLPELVTSVVAAYRRQAEIALGNIIGSNIFNVLGILGVTALVAPIPVAERFLVLDLPVMIGASLLLTLLLLRRQILGRGVGLALLLCYAAYLWAAQL